MRGYAENAEGDVVVTMSRDDWFDLMFLLGAAAGGATGDENERVKILALLGRLNRGNPGFAMHQLPPREEGGPR